jgi:hypothetical protein
MLTELIAGNLLDWFQVMSAPALGRTRHRVMSGPCEPPEVSLEEYLITGCSVD